MARTILVGDVHGCRRELEDLLKRIGLGTDDRLILVGDLVVRGPDPHGTLALLRDVGAESVRGNHEDRLLRWRGIAAGKRDPQIVPIGGATRRTAELLRPRDWEHLASLPLWLDLPDHGVRVVHAGVARGVAIEQQDPRTLMYVRSFDPAGLPIEERGHPSWAHGHAGPEHIVYGHHAKDLPEIAEHATGLDTGCVYGGRLTAMVLLPGKKPPTIASREDVLVSVPARRAWAER